MRKIHAVIAILIFAASQTCGVETTVSGLAKEVAIQSSKDLDDLKRVHDTMLTRFPELAGLEGIDLATRIRGIVHRETRLGSNDGLFDSPYQALSDAIYDKSSSHLCQGINIIFRIALTAFGFETRLVSYYSDDKQNDGEEPVNSHASTDVKIDGSWLAMDATYNFTIKKNGSPISWMEAYQSRHIWSKIELAYDGEPFQIDSRWRGSQVQPSHMRYVVFGGYEIQFAPSSWTGVFQFGNQLPFNIFMNSFPIDHRLPRLARAIQNVQ